MSLNTLDRRTDSAVAPSASSMRVMETGLALIAIVVALLLNIWR